MPTLEIDGIGRVEVGDDFAKMAPEAQQAVVAHITEQASKGVKSSLGGPAPVTLVEPGISDPMGLTSGDMAGDAKANADIARSLFTGATLGLGPRIIAGAKSLVGAGSYADNLNDQNTKAAAFHQTAPSFDTGMGLLGGAAGALAGGAGLAAAGVRAALPATLAGKVAAGAGVGGLLGGVQGAGESPDWTDPAQTAKDAATGAVPGLFAGALVPAAAKGIGAGVRGLLSLAPTQVGSDLAAAGVGRGTANYLGRTLERDSLLPQNVAPAMRGLGPDAVAADVGDNLKGALEAAVLTPSEGRGAAKTALDTRFEGQNPRLNQDVTAALGPAQSPVALTNLVRDARSVEHQALPQVFGSAPPVDISDALAAIGKGLNTAEGPEKRALTDIQKMLLEEPGRPAIPAQPASRQPVLRPDGQVIRYEATPAVPEVPAVPPRYESRAQNISNIKTTIDNLINYGDPTLGIQPGAISREQGALADIRKRLSGALRDQVPGYSDVMDKSSALARRADAIEYGTDLLNGGKQAVWPEDLSRKLAALPAVDQPGVPNAMRAGVRSDIERQMKQNANDLSALKTALKGDGDWNRQKLATLYGQDNANRVFGAMDREMAYNDTRNAAFGNSRTAGRLAAKEDMAAAAGANPVGTEAGGIMRSLANMKLGDALAKAANKLNEGRIQNNLNRISSETARTLTLPVGQIEPILGLLAQHHIQSGAQGLLAQHIGNAGGAASGLLAYDAGRRRLRGAQ